MPRRPSTEGCSGDGPGGDLSRSVGRGLASQPAPGFGSAPDWRGQTGPLRRATHRHPARPWSGRRPRSVDVGLRRVDLPGTTPGQLWALRPRKLLPRRVDPRGDRRRARRVASAARRLGMSSPVLWVNDPGGAEVLSVTGWPALYDITDDWLQADRPAAELARVRRQEQDLLEACDEVVVCSPALQRAKSSQRGCGRHSECRRPRRLPHPRASARRSAGGSGGALSRHGPPRPCGVDLCVATARHLAAAATSRPGAALVLIGPTPLPPGDLSALRGAGVHVLGPRPSADVPAYLQHADVLLVPHVLTPFTASLDPIKAYEYRAARRPVVSTPVPGFVDTPDPLVTMRRPSGLPSGGGGGDRPPHAVGGGPPPGHPVLADARRLYGGRGLSGRRWTHRMTRSTEITFVSHTNKPGGGELALRRYLEATGLPVRLVTMQSGGVWQGWTR